MTIRDVEVAINEQARGAELIAAGYLNVDLERTDERVRDEKILAAVVTAGLDDILAHFLLPRRTWYGYSWTWAMMRQGRVVRSRTDYILE